MKADRYFGFKIIREKQSIFSELKDHPQNLTKPLIDYIGENYDAFKINKRRKYKNLANKL